MSDHLAMETDERGITTLTMQHGKVNALSTDLLGEIADAASAVASGAVPSRCVVITGGPKLFAAGADITQFSESGGSDPLTLVGPARVAAIGSAFRDALGAVEALPVPTIASVSGVAFGGGCELALACDLRIASSAARFGLPEILLGIIPGGGGTQRLARLVGPSVAKDLIFSGRAVDSTEALRLGLVNSVVDADDLDDVVDAMAARLAAGPPNALRLAKSVIDRGLDTDLARGLSIEADGFVEVFATPDAVVGVSSFMDSGPGNADFGGIA